MKDIRRGSQEFTNKFTIIGDNRSTMLKDFFGEDRVKKGVFNLYRSDIISHSVDLELVRNDYEDKIRVKVTPKAILSTKGHTFYRILETNHGIARKIITERVKILMSMAVAAVIKDSTFNIHDKHEYKKNIIYSLQTEVIRDVFDDTFKFDEGDIHKRFEKAFHYLWFNNQNNYTGYDKEIIRFSLENWESIK